MDCKLFLIISRLHCGQPHYLWRFCLLCRNFITPHTPKYIHVVLDRTVYMFCLGGKQQTLLYCNGNAFSIFAIDISSG